MAEDTIVLEPPAPALRGFWEKFIRYLRPLGGKVLIGGIAAIIAGTALITQVPRPGGFDGTCLVSNYEDWGPTYEAGECDANTTINLANNTGTSCNGSLTTEYGPMPVRIIANFTQVQALAQVFEFLTGCAGDGNNDTIDVMLEANGNGSTFGVSGDVFKFKPFTGEGPNNLQLTVRGECGDPGGHFDFFQNQSDLGTNVAIINPTSGNYAAGIPTCQAAGGMLFWSDTGDIIVKGGELIGCNHGLNGNAAKSGSGSSVENTKFRTGAASGTNCNGVTVSDACINTQGMALNGVVSQRWNGTTYANSPCQS